MIRRVALAGAAVALALTVAELVARAIDGYEILSPTLRRSRPPRLTPPERTRSDVRYLDTVRRAPGIDRSWYETAPPPLPRRSVLSPALQARLDRYQTDQIGALVVWNPDYLRRELCAGQPRGSLGILSDFLVYEPTEPGPYPAYRHIPHVSAPGVFVSNSFGWRGPDLAARKPPNTIRIAFVGASTTVDDYSVPFSHPEFIGHWLNLWASAHQPAYRFEVINAGRTGIDSNSIAAIVRQELLPIDSDLVVYYEGANEFAPMKHVNITRGAPKPPTTRRKQTAAEDYSAIVRRSLDAVWLITGGDGREPKKPEFRTIWPADVDEHDPDVRHTPLPMDLHSVVANLDSMRQSLAKAGSELAMSSFIWMVYDGMRLDLSRDLTLFRYLNDSYWPASYAHMRRMADFQNAVFRNFAAARHLPFLDIARDFPRDPSLFSDAIHTTEDGLRLQAWIYLQQLVPLVEARVTSHRWPKPASLQQLTPDWMNHEPKLLSRTDILAGCDPEAAIKTR